MVKHSSDISLSDKLAGAIGCGIVSSTGSRELAKRASPKIAVSQKSPVYQTLFVCQLVYDYSVWYYK